MTTTRALVHGDIPAIVALVRSEFTSYADLPVERHEAFMRAVTLDHPWADPDVSSLVAVDGDGRIVGLIAGHVRRMRYGDRRLRAAVCSHLVVNGAHRGSPLGLRLLRQFLAQPQELTFSDTATETVSRIWRLSGGFDDGYRSLEWMQIFRPVAWLSRLIRSQLPGGAPAGRVAPVGGLPFHVVGRRQQASGGIGPDGDRAGAPSATAPLTTSLLLQHLDALTTHWPLRLDYDAAFLDWVFPALERRSGAEVVRRMVFRGGRPLGWFAYVLRPGHCSRVVQLVAAERDAGTVVGELLRDARERGSAAIAGRTERAFDDALRAHRTVLGYADRFVWHTNDPEVAAAIPSRRSLLSRLDGEWW